MENRENVGAERVAALVAEEPGVVITVPVSFQEMRRVGGVFLRWVFKKCWTVGDGDGMIGI